MRYGNQDIGMLYPERIRIFGNPPEREDEGTGKPIGDLQTDAQTHGKDEKQGHTLLPEQRKGTKPQSLHHALAFRRMAYRTCRKGQGVSRQQQAQNTGKGELSRILLHTAQIYGPHGTNEADRTEHAYRREVFHRIQTGSLQSGISHGIGQRDSGHKESHAQRIKSEQGGK